VARGNAQRRLDPFHPRAEVCARIYTNRESTLIVVNLAHMVPVLAIVSPNMVISGACGAMSMGVLCR